MAYRFPIEDLLTSQRRVRQAIAAAPSGAFGADESMAVWLGMRDDAATLRRPGRFSTWLSDLLGLLPKWPLTDPRLESLRRLTVSLRLGLRSSGWEEAAARRSGVTHHQIMALRTRFTAPAQAAT